jgi:hypothetical protein
MALTHMPSSATVAPPLFAGQAVTHQNDDFTALGRALHAGALARAQHVWAAVQQKHPKLHNLHEASVSPSSRTVRLFQQDITALHHALQSDNLADAQQAFSTLRHHVREARHAQSHSQEGQRQPQPPQGKEENDGAESARSNSGTYDLRRILQVDSQVLALGATVNRTV